MKDGLVPLGDILLDARPGFACGEHDPEGVFQFRMNNVTISGALDLSKIRRVPRATRNIERYHLEPGDVLFNATNSPELVGKTAYFGGYSEPAVHSNHFLRLRPNRAKADGAYVARWLQSQFQRGVFSGLCRQWVNQATVGSQQLLALRVPLPPLPEQRRIAAVLDRAEALRAKRRTGLAHLDTLASATFLDLFGDPLTNPKRWDIRKMKEIGKVVTGNTPSRERPEYFGDEIEWIKSDNLNTPHYYATVSNERLSEAGRAVARVAPAQSILVTCIAGSPECIGNAAMIDREVAFNQQINAVVPETGNPHFVYAQILVGKRKIRGASTGGMKGMVSKSRFEQIPLLFPPIELQNIFAEAILGVERVRRAQHKSLAHLDTLFASLQHRAFRGEL